jgi:hypothetical protein
MVSNTDDQLLSGLRRLKKRRGLGATHERASRSRCVTSWHTLPQKIIA